MYKIQEIAELLDGEIVGDDSLVIAKLSPFFQSNLEDITFASDEKIIKKLLETKAKVIIVPEMPYYPPQKTFIVVRRNPRELMPSLLLFFKPKIKPVIQMIETSSIIAKNAKISPIHTYIGHDVEIGEETVIYPNVTICEGVKIGKNCIIYSNVTIREFCVIGDNVILQPGAVIGSDGFGFVKINNENIKIEQIGNVVIENNVELGANTCVDRATIGETIIKKGTKVDNLVHIAHNDIIGENVLIVAQVGISGSVEVGDNVIMAGQSAVAGHLKIGNNVLLGARTGVTNDIPDNAKVSGFPARDHMTELRLKSSLAKLPDLIKRVKKLEKNSK